MRCDIRNAYGSSMYFNNQFREYGRYQWNIKYHGWESDMEIEVAFDHFFGSQDEKTHSFHWITELLGRPVDCSIEGRSGGWFVIHSKLSKKELDAVDTFIDQMLHALPDYLSDERREPASCLYQGPKDQGFNFEVI